MYAALIKLSIIFCLKNVKYLSRYSILSIMEGHLITYGEKVKLDRKDRKILEILNTNARSSVAEISRKTGIQRDSVLYRIKKMEKQKVIRYYHTLLNPSVIGYPIYSFVNIILSNITSEKEKSFVAYLKTHPNIVYAAKTTGKWDFTICIVAKNLSHFDEILSETRRKFSGIIKDYESSSIIQEYKFDYMVGLV
jgi:DNA-binding Lrp family transcriptional regulator